MGSNEKHKDLNTYTGCDVETPVEEKSNTGTKNVTDQSRKSRKRIIVIGVILAVTVIILVAVVVPVIVLQNKDNAADATEKDDGCGPYSYPGVNISQLTPRIISGRKTCPLGGDCWSGTKCYQCFKLDNWKVGNINNIPVCCPQCVRSGLQISGQRCDCLYNG